MKEETRIAICESISESEDVAEFLVAHALVNIDCEGIVLVREANLNNEAILLEKGKIIV